MTRHGDTIHPTLERSQFFGPIHNAYYHLPSSAASMPDLLTNKAVIGEKREAC